MFKDKNNKKEAFDKNIIEFDRAFNAIPDLIFVQDKDSTIIMVNAAFAKALKAKPEDIIGKKCYDLFHKLDKPWPGCLLEKTQLDGSPHSEEVNDPATGLFLLIATSPIFGDKGDLVGAVHITKNITKGKRLERELMLKTTFLEAQTEASLDGLLVVDSHGQQIMINQQLINMWKVPQHIIEQKDDAALLQYVVDRVKDPKQFMDKVKYLYSRQNEISRDEIEFKDGIVYDRYSSPVIDKYGTYFGRIWSFRDITGKKQAEKILKDSEIRYKTIFNSSADAIMLIIPGDGFISANRATIKMFGCIDEKEFIGKHPADISPEYQPDGELSLIKADNMMKLALEKGSHFFEWKHKRLNGEEFFATALLTRMELEGKVILQATVRDVTEQKKIEEELKNRLLTLERFQKITVGRELKMKELKAKLAELEAKLAQK